MSASRHNLNCTCLNCSGTGMTLHEQIEFCAGTGQRKIVGPDRLVEVAQIEAIERTQTFKRLLREEVFDNYPNK